MKMLAAALLALTAGLALSPAHATDTSEPTALDLRAARCVAALDLNTQDLAQQVKSGKEAAREVLLDRLVSGAAFVGDAYLHGTSDEHQARDLAEREREAHRSLPARERAARQAECAEEGAKLYSAGNGLQRAIVKRLAKKRMDKLLGT